ncbi:MAG: transglutaminase domain-containing protein [Planctomycetota bacterium]|nr:transglutaminase domain-containing protein [Planctomycetota bacterium]
MSRTSSPVRSVAVILYCAVAMNSCVSVAQTIDLSQLVPESKEFLLRHRRELAAMKESPVTYEIRQIVKLDQIPQSAKEILIWIAIPSDEMNQRVLALGTNLIPGEWKIVEDADRRGKFIHSRITAPASTSLEFPIDYTLTRSAVFTKINPARVRLLSELERSLFAEHLAKDSLHMEVTSKVQGIADDVCGQETNTATQSIAIMKHIARSVDHYSYSNDRAMPRCGLGDAQACLAQGGGCCTDLNSLFIALARARGIPARLNMGYRLLEENANKLVDPGYRCWVEYYIPGYGWVSADIVEADAPNGKGHIRWLTGLTPRRVWLNQGRQFRFADAHAGEPVNHMNIAYAEIDGTPARILPEGDLALQLTRQIKFVQIPPSDTQLEKSALTGAVPKE